MKTIGFPWKLYKLCFSGPAEDVFAKNRSTGLKFTTISESSRFSMKIVQNVLFREWRGRFDQIAFLRTKNRSAGPKFTPIRENSRLSMKIVLNVLFRPCGGRFGQIAFFNVPDPKIALPLSMKTVPNVLLRPCGGRFDQIAFLNVSEPKIALRDRNLRQYVKTVSFVWKLYKTCFSGHAGNVLAKSHFSKF